MLVRLAVLRITSGGGDVGVTGKVRVGRGVVLLLMGWLREAAGVLYWTLLLPLTGPASFSKERGLPLH
jgi:hypothetical protein